MINKIINSFFSMKNIEAFKNSQNIIDKIEFNGIYHYHIRKTGGTSLNTAFLNISENESKINLYRKLNCQPDNRLIINDKTYVTNNKILAEYTPYFYAYGHRPYHKLRIPKDRFTFTCFREPVARMLSHYKMIYTAYKRGDSRKDYKNLYRCLGSGLLGFVQKLPKELRLEQLYMFSSNYSVNEFYYNLQNVNLVLFTEYLYEGFEELNNKLKLNLKYIHKRKSSTKLDLKEDELIAIRELLLPEIEVYNELLKSKGYA